MQEATVFTMGGAGAASTTTIRSLLIPDDDAIASDENQSRGLCARTSVRVIPTSGLAAACGSNPWEAPVQGAQPSHEACLSRLSLLWAVESRAAGALAHKLTTGAVCRHFDRPTDFIAVSSNDTRVVPVVFEEPHQ